MPEYRGGRFGYEDDIETCSIWLGRRCKRLLRSLYYIGLSSKSSRVVNNQGDLFQARQLRKLPNLILWGRESGNPTWGNLINTHRSILRHAIFEPAKIREFLCYCNIFSKAIDTLMDVVHVLKDVLDSDGASTHPKLSTFEQCWAKFSTKEVNSELRIWLMYTSSTSGKHAMTLPAWTGKMTRLTEE